MAGKGHLNFPSLAVKQLDVEPKSLCEGKGLENHPLSQLPGYPGP